MSIKNIIRNVCISAFFISASATAATADNLPCPSPSEVTSTDFTVPSIWTAPPVAHAKPGQVGVGFGGKEVKELIGTDLTTVAHKKGWVCVYRSDGVPLNDIEKKVRDILSGNKFLARYVDKVDKVFDENRQPFLRKYPKDQPIGFVVYQRDESQNKK